MPGEQFIEDEITYWGNKQEHAEVTIVPRVVNGEPRRIPTGIKVNLALGNGRRPVEYLRSLFLTLFSKIFWNELSYIYKDKNLKVGNLIEAFRVTSIVIRLERSLRLSFIKDLRIDVAYCYWNDVQAYASVLLKRKGLVKTVVSRAHGFDLYEDRRSNSYMPLKRQFIHEIDLLLAISSEGKNYLQNIYKANIKGVCLCRMGVPIPSTMALVSGNNELYILSVSNCVALKRIDRIIKSIHKVALKNPTIKINWTHIGDGPLLNELSNLAKNEFNLVNIRYKFLGAMKKSEVMNFIEKNYVDIFINTSDFEGLPVSIMEAMSYGIPVIAPNIGGISEIVSNDCGLLLSKESTIDDIADAIEYLYSTCKLMLSREMVKKKIIDYYNAEHNYRSAIDLIISDLH